MPDKVEAMAEGWQRYKQFRGCDFCDTIRAALEYASMIENKYNGQIWGMDAILINGEWWVSLTYLCKAERIE